MNNITVEEIKSISVIIAVLLIGGGTLIGAFKRMKGGFGPQNLRIVVIILVATFVTLAGFVNPNYLNAAIGVLGAIVGYIFGVSRDPNKQDGAESSKGDEVKRR
jgi:hypothetical protein